jgi:hypothetical protein
MVDDVRLLIEPAVARNGLAGVAVAPVSRGKPPAMHCIGGGCLDGAAHPAGYPGSDRLDHQDHDRHRAHAAPRSGPLRLDEPVNRYLKPHGHRRIPAGSLVGRRDDGRPRGCGLNGLAEA